MTTSLCRLSLSLTLPRNSHILSRNHLLIETHKAQIHALKPEPAALPSSNTSIVDGQLNAALTAHELSDETPELDVVSVTTIIGRFAKQRQYKEAIHLFSRMLILNIRPSEFTFGTLIPSSTAVKDVNLGRQFHGFAMKIGLNCIVFVGSALLDFYAKLSSIEEAQRAFEDIQVPNVVSFTTLIHGYLKKGRCDDALRLFKEMPKRNVVSWNAMIGGYSQMGHNEEAVSLFIEMLREGLMPSQSTFPCAIIAAANIAALGMGKSFHAVAIKCSVNFDVFVGNSLISFYAKCGSMEDSLLVFDKLCKRSIVSCNAVICGFAQNGRAEDAVNFYERMQATGLRPDSVTLLGLLWACNHAGLVDKGCSYFKRARVEYPSMLKPEHYACMVNMLSRCGHFKEAQRFFHNLPFDPGIGFWKALLGGCQIHSNTELGEFVAQKILALNPEDVSSYVMLSNAHSAAGKWQNTLLIRREMKERGFNRVPGCSWIEIRSKVHVFVNGDKSHAYKDDIYMTLKFCIDHLRQIKPPNFFVEYY